MATPNNRILITKLRPPARRGGLVSRAAFLPRPCSVSQPRLAVIQQGAGFGKASLLRQLYDHLRATRPTAWLSLEPSDNDYPRFLLRLISAIESGGIAIAQALKDALTCGARLAPRTSCELLSDALAAAGSEVVICIDNIHVLTDASSTQFLSQLTLATQSRVACVTAGRAAPASPPLGAEPADLNQREIDILQLAASDVPNREIARRLFLSEHTVKWYWKQIFGKLSVHRRLQAVISAREAGLIY